MLGHIFFYGLLGGLLGLTLDSTTFYFWFYETTLTRNVHVHNSNYLVCRMPLMNVKEKSVDLK